MSEEIEFVVIYCACPNEGVAEEIASHLVEKRLAACVNMVPAVRSFYRWQGNTERDEEVLLMIKARKASFDTICESIQGLHPYQIPELIAVEITNGLPGYLSWLAQETS